MPMVDHCFHYYCLSLFVFLLICLHPFPCKLERCKSLRQNGERQKATINDLQSNLKLNKQELSDLQQKSQRIRSEHKSATTEAHALKETLG